MKVFMSALVCAFAAVFATTARAEYPERPVSVIVPYSGGTGVDVSTRIIVDGMKAVTGKDFVVENKPGAGAMLGVREASGASADGYTLVVVTGAHTLPRPAGSLTIDISQFTPIGLMTTIPSALAVSPGLQAEDLKGFVAFARSNPGKVSFASSGVGTVNHFIGEMLASEAGVELLHVPYKQTSQAVADLLSGHVNAMLAPASVLHPQTAKGVKLLGTPQEKRSRAFPGLPTFAEQGFPKTRATNWFGLMAPPNMSAETSAFLRRALAETLRSKGVAEQLARQKIDVVNLPAEQLLAHIASEKASWSKLSVQLGLN